MNKPIALRNSAGDLHPMCDRLAKGTACLAGCYSEFTGVVWDSLKSEFYPYRTDVAFEWSQNLPLLIYSLEPIAQVLSTDEVRDAFGSQAHSIMAELANIRRSVGSAIGVLRTQGSSVTRIDAAKQCVSDVNRRVQRWRKHIVARAHAQGSIPTSADKASLFESARELVTGTADFPTQIQVKRDTLYVEGLFQNALSSLRNCPSRDIGSCILQLCMASRRHYVTAFATFYFASIEYNGIWSNNSQQLATQRNEDALELIEERAPNKVTVALPTGPEIPLGEVKDSIRKRLENLRKSDAGFRNRAFMQLVN